MDLRELRKQRGLTQEALAFLGGDLDAATVSRIERGLVEPRRDTVVRLAKALGISVRRMMEILEVSKTTQPTGGAS